MEELLQRIVSLMPKKPDGTLVHGCKKELTDHLGLPSNTMAEWLSGRSKSYRIYVAQIAEYYGVTPSWLLGTSEQKKDPSTMNREEVDEELFDLAKELQENYDLRRILFSMRGEDPQNVKNVADMLESFRKRRDD